jgi:transcriptional regulator with GAF, ATPase, and Fis domain
VLITGESGTGKELVAATVHELSRRVGKPYLAVNCAAVSPALIDSELFGHERGSFTGAERIHHGYFERADGGSLLLDEVSEMPLELQAKLLRVIEAGALTRVGGEKMVKVDVRIIAASNRDLDAAVANGKFREDLLYRLKPFPIHLPPLRERPDDIPELAAFFLEKVGRREGKALQGIAGAALERLVAHDWPGNVRELENVIERALILSAGRTLSLDESFGALIARPGADRLDHVEREHLRRVLERCGWRINGQGHAADVLGLHPNTLRSRMAKLGIRRPARRAEPRP